MAEITASLKEREAKARAAEEVAAAHLAREKRLIHAEGALVEREQAVERAAADAKAAHKELEAVQAAQATDAARLAESAAALEERRADVEGQLAARESALADREDELAAAMQQFEAERAAAAEEDDAQRAATLAELRRLEGGIDATMEDLRAAEAEAEAMRSRLAGVQRETAEAEAARDKALLAHKAAQQVGGTVYVVVALLLQCCARFDGRCSESILHAVMSNGVW